MRRRLPVPARAAALALCAAVLPAQSDAPEPDWAGKLEKAVSHPRYGLRRAVARDLAAAGDAAVPALRARQEAEGGSSIPLLVVEAIAEAGTRGAAVEALLADWADDRAFPWRAQALRGLALRALDAHRPRFRAALADPSWLSRVEGARGLLALAEGTAPGAVRRLVDADPDPRARVRVAALLAARGDPYGVPVLLDALDLEAELLGDPWGRREARAAADALEELLQTEIDPGAEGAARALAAARARFGGDMAPGTALEDAGSSPAGGLAVRSCRAGDLFLRWSADGAVTEGLLGRRTVELPAPSWEPLAAELPALHPEARAKLGQSVCDTLRLRVLDPEREWVVAPGALPAAMEEWLRELADAVRHNGGASLADEMEKRLPQFTGAR